MWVNSKSEVLDNRGVDNRGFTVVCYDAMTSLYFEIIIIMHIEICYDVTLFLVML